MNHSLARQRHHSFGNRTRALFISQWWHWCRLFFFYLGQRSPSLPFPLLLSPPPLPFPFTLILSPEFPPLPSSPLPNVPIPFPPLPSPAFRSRPPKYSYEVWSSGGKRCGRGVSVSALASCLIYVDTSGTALVQYVIVDRLGAFFYRTRFIWQQCTVGQFRFQNAVSLSELRWALCATSVFTWMSCAELKLHWSFHSVFLLSWKLSQRGLQRNRRTPTIWYRQRLVHNFSSTYIFAKAYSHPAGCSAVCLQ